MSPFRTFALAGAIILLSACAIPATKAPGVTLSPQEAVSQRAAERWQLIVDQDFKAAYEYLTPASRSVMSFESFAARMVQAQIRWLGAEDVKVTCEDEATCTAEVLLNIKVHAPGVGQIDTQTVQYEDWLLNGGQWYYLPAQVM